jgi:hypothetical protein
LTSFRRWLDNYEAQRHGDGRGNHELKENWMSSKYDFSDPNVRLEYVPEIGCNVGGCISSLKKSWKAYRIAKRYSSGEERYLAYRIRSIQSALAIEQTDFEELNGLIPEESEDEVQLRREEEESDFGTTSEQEETDSSEWSKLDRQLLKEEQEAEEEQENWWFS